MILPWGEKTHAVTKPLPFFELSGNTYVMVVYASPPLNLRLSPGDRGRNAPRFSPAHLRPVKVRSRGRLATFRKMRLPVALELLELLATVNIPQPDRLVVRPTDKQGGIRRIETDAIYFTAVAFQRRLARAQCHVPYLEGPVFGS